MSTAPRPIAVVLDGPPTPAWQARALVGLQESPLLRVVGVGLAGAVRVGLAVLQERARPAVPDASMALGTR